MGVVAPLALGPISIPSSYLRPQVLFLALILLKILMLKCPKPKNLPYKFVSDTFLAIQTIKLFVGHVKIYWKCLRIMAFKVTRWSRWQTTLGPIELALLWHRRIPNFHWAQCNYLCVSLRFNIRILCTTLCPKMKIQVISRLCILLGWCRSGYEMSHLRTR